MRQRCPGSAGGKLTIIFGAALFKDVQRERAEEPCSIRPIRLPSMNGLLCDYFPLFEFTKLKEPLTVADPPSGGSKLRPRSTPWIQLTTEPLRLPPGLALAFETAPLPPMLKVNET